MLDRIAPPLLIAAIVVVAVRELMPPPRRRTAPAAATVRVQPPGRARVDLPASVPQELTRVSLIRNGDYARTPDGVQLRDVRADYLEALPLTPGLYVAMFTYREAPVGGDVVQVDSGHTVQVRVPVKKMAEVEYAAALEAPAVGNTDVARFQRTARLDPQHVNARLQLAAWALSQGDRRMARAELASVRRIDPRNPHLQRVARLLERAGN